MTEIAAKSIDDSFIDWEAEAFGFGYGTGEEHVLGALKAFFGALKEGRTYDYADLERELGPAAAWLMINALCRDGVIDYGTSPRYGWLSPEGEALRNYVAGKSVDDLLTVLSYDCDHTTCSRNSCNCGERGYVPGRLCPNPFWRGHHP